MIKLNRIDVRSKYVWHWQVITAGVVVYGDFSDASSPLYIDDMQSPYQIADARHRDATDAEIAATSN